MVKKEITYAQESILKRIAEKHEDFSVFQDHSDYSDYFDYGDNVNYSIM